MQIIHFVFFGGIMEPKFGIFLLAINIFDGAIIDSSFGPAKSELIILNGFCFPPISCSLFFCICSFVS